MAAWITVLVLGVVGLTGAVSKQSGFGLESSDHVRSKRTMNMDARYSRWIGAAVLYCYDMTTNYYTTAEIQLIETAIQSLQSQLSNAIQFIRVDQFDPRYKVKITPFDTDPRTVGYSPDCHSYPGALATQIVGDNSQKMVLVRGEQGGCLSTVRSVMKFFVILLGRRNEFQRRDRDNFMTIYQNNLIRPEAFRIYAAFEDDESTPFDPCSITFEEPTRYARQPGTKAWSFKDGYDFVPTEPILSTTECQTILNWYGRSDLAPRCQQYDCTQIRQTHIVIVGTLKTTVPLPPAPVTTIKPAPAPVPATTPRPAPAPASSPTTTAKPIPSPNPASPAPHILTETTPAPNPSALPCECSNFCNVAPTESAYLAGPYQFYQTYLLFSGTCVAEYVMDWDKTELQIQTVPTPFSTYFGSPGGKSLQSPVTLAFMTLETPQSTSYNVYFQSQIDLTSLHCTGPGNGAGLTKGDVCPKAADSTNVIPTSIATSASPQLNQGNNTVYQYVVDSSSTNIKLMDASFKTTYQTSTGFLDGQSKIMKITAIQIAVDDIAAVDIHPFVLTVFGLGADNVTPYVGFVQMALYAHPETSLSPRKWLKEPVPLKKGISNCESLKLRPLTRKVPPPNVTLVKPKTSPRPIY